METNDSNLKPQATGGLKLMTVFIAVLALHVLVIGGFTVYHLLSVATSDQDLTLDKSHKAAKVLPDGSLAGDLPGIDGTDKATTATTAPTDSTSAPTASTEASAPASTASGETAATTTTPTTPAATTDTASTPAPVAITEPTPSTPTASTPSGPVQHGPVIDPPENLAPKEASDASAPSASSASEGAPTTDGIAYIVKPGDSLARIARRNHVSLAKLRAANSFSSDRLHIGQKVMIPARTQTVAMNADAEAPVSAPADGASTDSIAPIAPAPHHAHLAKSGAATISGHHFYTVVKGDTLTKIARKFRTTPSALMAANNLTNAARLNIGKKLRIPSSESRSASSAPVSEPVAPTDSKPAPKGQLANYVQ
jgi:LysM repeat protein